MTVSDVIQTFGRRDVLLIVGLGLLSVILWNVPVIKMILASFESLLVLLSLSRTGRGKGSDAEKMEQLTGIPAASWALLWCVTAVAILIWSITVAYRDLPLQ